VQNVQIGLVSGGYGSLKVIGNVTAHDFLFGFRNYASTLYRFRDIASIWRTRGGVTPVEFAEIFGVRKLEPLCYRMVFFV